MKSQKLQNRLVLVVETEKEKTQRKDFVFDDTKVSIPFLVAKTSSVAWDDKIDTICTYNVILMMSQYFLVAKVILLGHNEKD